MPSRSNSNLDLITLQKSVLNSSIASFINRVPESDMNSQISAAMGKSQVDIILKYMKDASFCVTTDLDFMYTLAKICYNKA